MLKKLSIMAVLLVFAFSMLSAQEKSQKPAQKPFGPLAKLNLTDEQKEKMRDLRAELEKKQIALRSKIQILKVEAKQLLTADKIDRSAIEKKANEIAKLSVDLKLNHLDNWIAVNNILTPDQQKIWKKMLNFDGKKARNFMKSRMRMGRGMRGSRGGMSEFMPGDQQLPTDLFGANGADDQMDLMEAIEPPDGPGIDSPLFGDLEPPAPPDDLDDLELPDF